MMGLTAPALLGIAVLMLLLGHIVPRSILEDKKREASEWKAAYEAEREARAIIDRQTGELLEVSKTTHALTVAMFDVVRKKSQEAGDTDVVPPK